MGGGKVDTFGVLEVAFLFRTMENTFGLGMAVFPLLPLVWIDNSGDAFCVLSSFFC